MIHRKKVLYEEDLHELFYRFPYFLVDKPDSIINTIHEYKLNSDSIPDIYIETINENHYFEIKLGALKEIDLYQAIRYLNFLEIRSTKRKSEVHKENFVYLVGLKISRNLENKAIKKGIHVKIIGREIPESIIICKDCRRAYDFKRKVCNFCDSVKQLEIINLKYI